MKLLLICGFLLLGACWTGCSTSPGKGGPPPEPSRSGSGRELPDRPAARGKPEPPAPEVSGSGQPDTGEPAPPRKTARADAASEGPAARRSPALQKIIRELGSRDTAEKTFWKLAEVDQSLIPELIGEVECEESSALHSLKILVVDRGFVEHLQQFAISRIPGMGKMEDIDEDGAYRTKGYYTKSSYTVAENGKGYKVVIDKIDGFPMGVVIRAALINRFRSDRYPRGIDHTRDLTRWWRSYYRNVYE